MRKFIIVLLALAMSLAFAPGAMAGINDRFSGIELGDSGDTRNVVIIPALSGNPSGTPPDGYLYLYVKDGGTTILYIKDDGGTVTSLSPSLTATDFALTTDADAGDFDIDSLDRLEFYDVGLYIDGGTDGVLLISSDGTLEIATADWDISTTGVITNAAMSADQITAAALGIGANPFTIGNSYMEIGTDPADAGTIRLPNAFSILAEAAPTGGDVTVLEVNATEDILIGSANANSVIITPDMVISGALQVDGATTLVGTFYLSDISPAAGNLTINAQLGTAGTITFQNSSTGDVTFEGGVVIGDGATDNLTITGIIIADVTLDDGGGDSPAMIWKDSDNETGRIHQDQATDDLEVTLHSAADSFAITTGNLSVGTPAAGVIGWDGDDFYVTDDAEIDGTLVVDTDLDVNGPANISGVLTLGANGLTLDGGNNNIFEWNESAEDLLWTFAGTSIDLSSTSGIATLEFFDNAPATLTHVGDHDTDDWTISQTGANDVTLTISSTGTGNDALVLSTSAGGIDITVAGAAAGEDLDLTSNMSINLISTEAATGQIILDAQGTVAGVAIEIKTSDGRILVNAVGGTDGDLTLNAGDDILIAPTDDLTLTSTGLTLINPTETLALSSSDWGISTTGVATNMASIGFDSGSVIHHVKVTLNSAQVRALTTPIELIATPGASAFIEVVSVVMYLEYGGTNVFTLNADSDLVLEYGTSNDDITGSIETSGWLDQGVDQVVTYYPSSPQVSNVMSDLVNNNVELLNTGTQMAGNGGNDNNLILLISYRVHPWS